MSRTDRQLAVILELERRSPQRAEDLAATFEVSKRTIYRDIDALSAAGVPVVAVTGQGYSLVPGYFLPPVNLTVDEAFMLILGSHVMAQHFDAQYRTAAQSANRKVEVVLSEGLRTDVRYLETSISFLMGDGLFQTKPDHLRQLRRAIIDRRQVQLQYHKRYAEHDKNVSSIRKVDPYGLIHLGSAWYLVAFCHTRQELRHFRLSRIQHLEITEETFARPKEFHAAWRQPSEDRPLHIRVMFDHEAAQWLHESRSFYIMKEEKHPAGLLVTLQVRHESEVMSWLLSWGSHICILEPESVRSRFTSEAEKMLQNHRSQAMSY